MPDPKRKVDRNGVDMAILVVMVVAVVGAALFVIWFLDGIHLG